MDILFLSTCALLAFAVGGQFFRRTEIPALAAGAASSATLLANAVYDGSSGWFYLLNGAGIGFWLFALSRAMKTRKAATQ